MDDRHHLSLMCSIDRHELCSGKLIEQSVHPCECPCHGGGSPSAILPGTEEGPQAVVHGDEGWPFGDHLADTHSVFAS